MSGVRHSDSHVEYDLDTATGSAPRGTRRVRARRVADLLRSSGLQAGPSRPAAGAVVEADLQRDREHRRGVDRLPHVGAFAASKRRPTSAARPRPDGRGKRVAAAAGVELHEDPWEMNVHAVQKGRPRRRRRAFPVDAGRRPVPPGDRGRLHHRLARARGRPRVGVPVPLHTAMYRLVKAREAATREPSVCYKASLCRPGRRCVP